MERDSLSGRRGKFDEGPSMPPWWLVILFAGALTAITWVGWHGGLLEGQYLVVLYFVLLGVFCNVALLAAFFWLWINLNSKRERRVQYNQELRYLRTWGGEEGRLRKQGLIRELNALGAVPGDLEQAVLTRADLAGANLRGCNLRGADLSEANLRGANLDGADLWGADLSGAKLNMASLRSANLRSANLENAELEKAQLTGANFHRCNLVNANLHGSDLSRVQLDRARFGARAEGAFQQTVHSSVEDWIRERLDEKGSYTAPGSEPEGDSQNDSKDGSKDADKDDGGDDPPSGGDAARES